MNNKFLFLFNNNKYFIIHKIKFSNRIKLHKIYNNKIKTNIIIYNKI